MGGFFVPVFEGELEFSIPAGEALAAVSDAVRTGQFMPGTAGRTRYRILQDAPDRLRFVAENLSTAIAVWLNDVIVETRGGDRLRYSVTFFRWFHYVLALCWGIGGMQAFAFLLVHYLGATALTTNAHMLPALFLPPLFCFVWPFCMVLFHRPVARRMLEGRLRAIVHGEAPGPEGVFSATPAGGLHYRSAATLLGLPLVHVALGPNRKGGGPRGVAKGFIAVGDVAFGVIALGGVAVGGVAFGGMSVGGIALGGIALGGMALGGVALGGAAVGLLALGGLAVGVVALGGLAVGVFPAGGLAVPPALWP